MKYLDQYFEEVLLVAMISIMSLLIIAQIFMRFVVGSSITWSEELARYFFIWMTWIGVSYGIKRNAHIKVTSLTHTLPDRLTPYLNILINLIFLVFCYIVVKEGIALSEKIFRFNQRSASLGMHMGYVYLAPVVGLSLTGIRILQSCYHEFKQIQYNRRTSA